MFPGYRHVQAFGQDGEYEDDEEVSYVTLDLGSNVDRALLPNTTEYRLVGLDTPTPLLQLSGTFFKGTHQELIGTEILFTDGRDEANPSRRFVAPVSTTEKRIRFEQIEVKEKKPEPATEEEGEGEQTKFPEGNSSRGRGKTSGKVKGKGRGQTKSKGKQKEGSLQEGESVLELDTPLSKII